MSVTSPLTGDTAALLLREPPPELSHELMARRLMLRYRRMLWLVAMPLFGLLALLAAWQANTAQRAAVGDLERRAATYHAATQALARAASEHVADLRHQAERDLLSPAHRPDVALRDAITRRGSAGEPQGYTLDDLPALAQPGLAQLLWPSAALPDDESLWRLQSLSRIAELAHNRNPDFVWSYYFSWPGRHVVIYPWVRSDSVLEQLGRSDLVQTIDAWYEYPVFRSGRPEARPSRDGYWTRAYVDAGGAGLVISQAAPVYTGDDFRGVVGVDIKLSALTRLLDAQPPGAGRWWVVSQQGEVLAPARAGAGGAEPNVVATMGQRLPPGVDRAAIGEALREQGRALAIAGQRVVAIDVPSAPWTLVCALSDREVAALVLPGLVPFLLLGIALLAMFLFGQGMLRRRLVEPALGVMGYLEAMSRDASTPEPRLGVRWQPWVQAVTATFRAQREARERERRSEAFKSAIVDNALAAIVATDAQGRIVEFNPSAENMFGRTRAQVLGQQVGDLIIPERFREAHEQGMARMRRGEAPRVLGRRMEMQAMRADGREFPVEMVLWRTDVGGETHYSASLSDVSAARDAARQIERQREALRQRERLSAMGSLLASVAHELNNPLAIVMGRADLLDEKCEDQPELRADARRIREAAERCGRIVRTFLNMARNKPAERHRVSLNELVLAAVEMLAYSYRSHGIELERRLDPQLPAVDADGDQLGQVIVNLLVNAQQALAGAEGERRVCVSTGAEPGRGDRDGAGDGEAGHLWLRVADNGAGVPEGLRERIFEPFFTTKSDGTGTGLGLALSRSLARQHGGELSLEGGGPGAQFLLCLPLSEHGTSPAPPAPGAAVDLELPAVSRLLVVDDEPEIAELMRAMLESAGHEVSTAESGAVALELLRTARYDAIVSDLRMPDMDGAALWREVLREQPFLARRMLFVTGDALSADARQFLADSQCASLDKPFAKEELLRKVSSLLEAGVGVAPAV